MFSRNSRKLCETAAGADVEKDVAVFIDDRFIPPDACSSVRNEFPFLMQRSPLLVRRRKLSKCQSTEGFSSRQRIGREFVSRIRRGRTSFHRRQTSLTSYPKGSAESSRVCGTDAYPIENVLKRRAAWCFRTSRRVYP